MQHGGSHSKDPQTLLVVKEKRLRPKAIRPFPAQSTSVEERNPLPGVAIRGGSPWESLGFLALLCDFEPFGSTSWRAGLPTHDIAHVLGMQVKSRTIAESSMRFSGVYCHSFADCHKCRHPRAGSLFQAAHMHEGSYWQYVTQALLTGDLRLQIVMKYESFWFRNMESESFICLWKMSLHTQENSHYN